MKYLVLIFVLVLAHSNTSAQEITTSHDIQTIWVDSIKGTAGWVDRALLKKENVDDFFREDVLALHSEIAWENERSNKYIPSVEVKRIGRWGTRDVYDLYDINLNVKHILIESDDEIRLIYSLFPIDAKHQLSRIIKSGDTEILSTRSRIPGSGHYYFSQYFLYDAKNRKVKSLDLSVIHDTLEKILPNKHSVWKGGGFNIETLSFDHSVWKEGDANCCPSGGDVTIGFEIVDGDLKVISHEYLQK